MPVEKFEVYNAGWIIRVEHSSQKQLDLRVQHRPGMCIWLRSLILLGVVLSRTFAAESAGGYLAKMEVKSMIETIPAVTQMSCDYCQAVREAGGRPFVSLTLAGYADSAELAMVRLTRTARRFQEQAFLAEMR